MDNLNWLSTDGAIGKTRRFPTFIVEVNGKTGMFTAFDGSKNNSFFAISKTIDGLEKILRPPCNHRTL